MTPPRNHFLMIRSRQGAQVAYTLSIPLPLYPLASIRTPCKCPFSRLPSICCTTSNPSHSTLFPYVNLSHHAPYNPLPRLFPMFCFLFCFPYRPFVHICLFSRYMSNALEPWCFVYFCTPFDDFLLFLPCSARLCRSLALLPLPSLLKGILQGRKYGNR